MVEKSHSSAHSKAMSSHEGITGKPVEGNNPQNQIKLLDGHYTEKERRQVVMKLIQFMKAA